MDVEAGLQYVLAEDFTVLEHHVRDGEDNTDTKHDQAQRVSSAEI